MFALVTVRHYTVCYPLCRSWQNMSTEILWGTPWICPLPSSKNKIAFLYIVNKLCFFPDAVSEDTFHSDYLIWMTQQSSLLRSRSRRPLSVDDVSVAEAFLNESPLDNVYESFGYDSGVFLPSPLSSASSFNSYSEGYGMSSPDISGSFKTSTPNGHRWLYSCPEGMLSENV